MMLLLEGSYRLQKLNLLEQCAGEAWGLVVPWSVKSARRVPDVKLKRHRWERLGRSLSPNFFSADCSSPECLDIQ